MLSYNISKTRWTVFNNRLIFHSLCRIPSEKSSVCTKYLCCVTYLNWSQLSKMMSSLYYTILFFVSDIIGTSLNILLKFLTCEDITSLWPELTNKCFGSNTISILSLQRICQKLWECVYLVLRNGVQIPIKEVWAVLLASRSYFLPQSVVVSILVVDGCTSQIYFELF